MRIQKRKINLLLYLYEINFNSNNIFYFKMK